jgi:hypothetical protein
MPLIVRPPKANRICLLVFGGLLTAPLLGFVAWIWITSPRPIVEKGIGAAMFGSLALLMVLFVAWHLSVRAVLDGTTVTRETMFGTKSFAIAQIDSALYFSGRGSVFLNIKSGRHFITFSNYEFSRAQLDQIQAFLAQQAAKGSRSIQTSYPPWTTKQAIEFGAIYLAGLIAVFLAIAIAGIDNVRHHQPDGGAHGINAR